MKSTLKSWTGLGLGVALAGSALAGCSGEAGEAGEAGAADNGMAASAGEGGEAGASLTDEQRVAFMSGHVEAGLALYRAGEAEMAAPHLLHPVSETHASEQEGLEEYGFDPAIFREVSAALDAGRPASEIEPQLRAAQQNLRQVRDGVGGDAVAVVDYLMDMVIEEYGIAVSDGAVTDAGEYQDAWGFAKIARERAEGIEGDAGAKVRDQLDTLIALWPDAAPIPGDSPAPAGQVSGLASRVKLALPR